MAAISPDSDVTSSAALRKLAARILSGLIVLAAMSKTMREATRLLLKLFKLAGYFDSRASARGLIGQSRSKAALPAPYANLGLAILNEGRDSLIGKIDNLIDLSLDALGEIPFTHYAAYRGGKAHTRNDQHNCRNEKTAL